MLVLSPGRTPPQYLLPTPSLLAVPTHHQWEAPVFRIEFVETQVDDERSYGVEEGKDAQGHEELGGGREVSHNLSFAYHQLKSSVGLVELQLTILIICISFLTNK